MDEFSSKCPVFSPSATRVEGKSDDPWPRQTRDSKFCFAIFIHLYFSHWRRDRYLRPLYWLYWRFNGNWTRVVDNNDRAFGTFAKEMKCKRYVSVWYRLETSARYFLIPGVQNATLRVGKKQSARRVEKNEDGCPARDVPLAPDESNRHTRRDLGGNNRSSARTASGWKRREGGGKIYVK